MELDTSIVKKAYALLELERRIIGVKLIYDKDEFEKIPAILPVKPMYYCQAVAAAGFGNPVKLTREVSGCGGSSRALGFVPPADGYYTGESGCALGLYENREVAKSVALKVAVMHRPLYGVAVMPLENFKTAPDTVMIVCNTREAMRLAQGYTGTYGLCENFCLSGNQAVCVECTTYPLMKDRMNISVFCAGTRFRAGWKDYETAVGLPYSKFGGLVKGLENTVNAIERNPRKARIEKQLRDEGLLDFNIRYGKTYFLENDMSKAE